MLVDQSMNKKNEGWLGGNLVTLRSVLCCAGLVLACLLALAAHPVAAHANHGDAPVHVAEGEGLVADETLCGPGGYRVEGTEICTHGPDSAPEESEFAELASGIAVGGPTHAIRCDGDGVSGKRVQVMYVRSENVVDRYATVVDLIRAVARDIDAIFDASAHETGGHRHIRFVTDTSCLVNVLSLVVPAGADGTLAGTISALRNQGFTDPNRKYLMFVDTKVYCGIASTVGDSRMGSQNRSNSVVGYARVDNGCWDAIAAAHELTHNLGGIQKDAPNTSKGWHCTDEFDIMCYSDAPYYPTIRYICNNDRFSLLLDCNHDDYFHTSPAAGSYLATHWNVADSEFLIADEDDHAALPALALTTVNAAQTLQAGADIDVEVLLPETFSTGGYGYTVQRIDFFLADQLVASVTSAPYQYSWRADDAGDYTLTARAYDQNGKFTAVPALTLSVAAVTPKPTALQATLLPLVMN